MTITKKDNGWLVDIQPGGRGNKRYRKTLPTKGEALRWKAFIENKNIKTPDWQPDKKDTRRLVSMANRIEPVLAIKIEPLIQG